MWYHIKNRLFKSAMSEQLGTKDHQPTDGLVALYGRGANGGIGLAMTGNTKLHQHREISTLKSKLTLFVFQR